MSDFQDSRCCGNTEFMLTSKPHIKDFSCNEKKTGPILQTHSLRDFEKHLKDLKKENFSLKLRIYFLEEKIQQKFDDRSSEDIHRKNIELKVEVESLKQELYERQQLYDQELLIEELKVSVSSKEKEIASLNKEKDSLNQNVTQLEKELQKLVGEQQAQLVQYEDAAGQCVKDLQTFEQQVQVLQTKVMESDNANKELQQRLNQMQRELGSAQELAQQQESAIQMLTISLNSKDEEVADLKLLNEKQKELLVFLQNLNNNHQLQQHKMSGTTTSESQVELTRLQTSIFSTQLELQTSQRAQHQALIKGEDLVFRNRCLQSDLQQERHHRQEAEKHNQELLTTLQRAQSDLDQIEEKWQKELEHRMQEVKDKEKSIRELRIALQHKEGLLHDYYTLQKEPAGTQEALIHRLIQERDQALEHAVDETFVFTEQKENEVHKLQQLLRESEKDLRKLRCELENNDETIKSLELLVHSKTLELEQVNEAWKGSQQVQSQYVDQQTCSLKEKDALISKLQMALDTHVKKSKDLTSILLKNVEFSSDEVADELKAQLSLKDGLFQDLLAVHTRQAQEHDLHVQELLRMIHSRERYIKDSAERAGQMVSEQAARLQQIHRREVTAGGRTPSKSPLMYSKKGEHSILHPSPPTNQEKLQNQVSLKHKVFMAWPSLVETEQGAISLTDNEAFTSCEDEDVEYLLDDNAEEEESVVTKTQTDKQCEGPVLSQNIKVPEDQDMSKVKLLVQQKQAAKQWELKAQVEKPDLSSLSQMRNASHVLQSDNDCRKIVLRGTDVRRLPVEEKKSKVGVQDFFMDREKDCPVKLSQAFDAHKIIPASSPNLTTSLSHSKQLDLEGVHSEKPAVQKKFTVFEITAQTQAKTHGNNTDHVNKQDLQDLGYETCGRSENEAERDDTSSPEFDDLELCTSLSCRDTSQLWSGLGLVNKDEGDVAFLQQQVEDLQMQLSQSQTLVFSLQDRIKDVPATSIPGKVNQTDTQLQGLLSRVSSIEEQLGKGKSQNEEENKKNSWSSKFDTLIQTQARELSQLRQKMQEGRSMCCVLKQHLGDTTKAFEELLRANDIDYYMGQCFRDQLAQSSALAQRVGAKLSNRDYFEIPGDKKGDERGSVWLNKELEQKDKLIQLLHSKLEQQHPRADSPASSHASSKSTDQSSDHASLVMAEQGSSGDDLDLCSELDTASQFDLEEHRDLSPAASTCNQNFASEVTSSPPSLTLAHGNQFTGSSPSMHCIPFFEGQMQTDFGSTNFKPLSGFSSGSGIQTHIADVGLLSQHMIQQSPRSSLNASFASKPGDEILEKNSWWTMSHGVQSKEESTFGHLQACQSGISYREKDLMKEHLREVRNLCQSLSDSVHANDLLRQKLEERLGFIGNKTGSSANSNAELLNTVSQLSKEVKVLKEEKLMLQTQFQQASKEMEVLRKTVVLECSQLKQAEMEAENWKEQFRQLQVKLRESTQETQFLRHDKHVHQEHANRLQHEVNILQQQLNENSQLVNKLQSKLQEYQRFFGAKSEFTGCDPQEHPTPMGLLEQQLSERLKHKTAHTSARIKLFHDPSHSPPVRDQGFSSSASSASVEEPTATYHNCDTDFPRPCSRETKPPDGSFGNKTRSHVVGHWEDYDVLKQKVLEGEVLICRMEDTLQFGKEFNMFEDCVSTTKALKLILEKMGSALEMFWRESTTCPEKQLLKEEVLCLRRKLSVQEQLFRDAAENLRDSNCTKANMEQLIHDQLLRTREVLKKARTNLEIKCQAMPAVPLVDEV